MTYPISPKQIYIGFIYVNHEEFGLPRPQPSVTPAFKHEVLEHVQGWEDNIVQVAEVFPYVVMIQYLPHDLF